MLVFRMLCRITQSIMYFGTWYILVYTRGIEALKPAPFFLLCFALYTLPPSIGPIADPNVQSVSPQVTFKSSPVVGCHYFLPGLQPPSQPKNVTILWIVPSYTDWWQRHTSVNNLPIVLTQLCTGGKWTHNLLISSSTPYHYASAPFRRTDKNYRVQLYVEEIWPLHGLQPIYTVRQKNCTILLLP